MTARTTAVDHPSRRLVVALPQTYDEACERYESLVPEIDFARFSEVASSQATLELAEINAPCGLMRYCRSDITAAMSGSPSFWKTTYVDPDGDTRLAVDQPSLLFDSDDKPEIANVGRDTPPQLGTVRKAS